LLSSDAVGIGTGSEIRRLSGLLAGERIRSSTVGSAFVSRKSQARRFPLTRLSADRLPHTVRNIRSGTIADARLRRVRRRSAAIGRHQSSSVRLFGTVMRNEAFSRRIVTKFFTVKLCGTQSNFFYPAFSKWFKTVSMFSFLSISWLPLCRSCSIFFMISSTFPMTDRPERGASLTSKSILKTLESVLCHMYYYCIMSINITNFFSSLSRILSFFCNKISKCIKIFFYFHSFSKCNNF